MTKEERAVEQLKVAFNYLNDIEEAERNANMRFTDYSGVNGYASLHGYKDIQYGVGEPEKQKNPGFKQHNYKEFLQGNPSKDFIHLIIIGAALLFVGLNSAFISLASISTNIVLFIIAIIFAIGLLVAGLVVLLKGLSKRKQYSYQDLENREKAQKQADEANTKEKEEWTKRQQQIDEEYKLCYEEYLKKKETYRALYNEYQTFIKQEDNKAKQLSSEYKDYVEKITKDTIVVDMIPLTVFKSKEYIEMFLDGLKEWTLEHTIEAFIEYRHKEEEQRRIAEKEAEEYRLQQEEKERRLEEIRYQEQLRYENEMKIMRENERSVRESERRMREEREKQDREYQLQRAAEAKRQQDKAIDEALRQKDKGRQMCFRCKNVSHCQMRFHLSSPSCGGFIPK